MKDNLHEMSENSTARYDRRRLPLAKSFPCSGGTLLKRAPLTHVIVLGVLLLPLFVLQVAVLEVSDRLNIFPLYGFFLFNLLSILLLLCFIVKSYGYSFFATIRRSLPYSLARLCTGAMRGSNVRKAEAATRMVDEPVAVLLIIKRHARAEVKPSRHDVASATSGYAIGRRKHDESVQ